MSYSSEDAGVYEVDEGPQAGRYVVACYSERGAQWTGLLSPRAAKRLVGDGYRYSYARTLTALVALGVPTYATIGAARRSLAKARGVTL